MRTEGCATDLTAACASLLGPVVARICQLTDPHGTIIGLEGP